MSLGQEFFFGIDRNPVQKGYANRKHQRWDKKGVKIDKNPDYSRVGLDKLYTRQEKFTVLSFTDKSCLIDKTVSYTTYCK